MLKTSAPVGKTQAHMQTWLTKLKVSAPKLKKIEELSRRILQAYKDLEVTEQGEQLQAIAIEWGLPIALTTKMDTAILVKVLAAASILSK